jgi:DnaJ family protein A protein 5
MRCHYEVLGVERDVDDEALKKAYRKQALAWHPDKNMEQLELATETFKDIQASYAVLSDKHERAWYDDHREAILRGVSSHGGGPAGGNSDDLHDEGFDLWAYFSPSAYSGFGNDDRSFYSVYGKIFHAIDRAEREHGPRGRPAAPELGGNYSSWADIRSFYSYWESFATCKPFASVDLYDTRAAANRQVRRAMEKENEKARAGARRKANECVRALAAYAKKRDKRYIEHVAAAEREKAAAAERAAAERKTKQAEHDARRAQERRERTAAWDASEDGAQIDQLLANYSGEEEEGRAARRKKGKTGKRGGATGGAGQAEEDAVIADESGAAPSTHVEGDGMEGDGMETVTSTDDALEAAEREAAALEAAALEAADSLWCAACNKYFKNLRQWENHEQSKKHLQRVKQLRAELLAEDREAEAMARAGGMAEDGEEAEEHGLVSGGDIGSESEEDGSVSATMENLALGGGGERDSEDEGEYRSCSSDEEEEALLMSLARASEPVVEETATEVPLEAPVEVISEDGASDDGDEASVGGGSACPGGARQQQVGANLNAAARKRAKKALRQKQSGAPPAAAEGDGKMCQVCGLQCASRTKLFQHIQKTGHAVLKKV